MAPDHPYFFLPDLTTTPAFAPALSLVPAFGLLEMTYGDHRQERPW